MVCASAIDQKGAYRRGARASLALFLLSLAMPATALDRVPNLITKDVLRRQTGLYCRVSPDHRCAAPAGSRVGMSCRCHVRFGQSGRFSRAGHVVREPSFVRNRP
jgi:hypothetical protein